MTKICSKCKEEKSLDQFCKQTKTKDGLSFHCRFCRVSSHNAWKIKNKDKYLSYQKDYRVDKKESAALYKQDWYLKNKEAHYQKKELWKKQNPDYDRKRYLLKRDYYISKALKRNSGIKQAFPSWANIEKIQEIYKNCKKFSEETGIIYHVDHIIPLNGKLVSGLHVENNLRIITAEENLKKQAKFLEELL